MKFMKLPALTLIAVFLLASCGGGGETENKEQFKSISLARLKDKIKGGWAGQTIGVTFGGPTEFRYNGTFIQDYQSIEWHKGYLKETMQNNPGLFDDIYMDLTFVEVLDRVGLDAPVDSFARAFADAKYPLWHANQAARYNFLNGIKGTESGHWLNNPHADDIDYQIESDFAGLMNPGMPNSASKISDKVGHIMNYGDGWYGGIYVGAMYSLAFVSDDVEYVVKEALKTIPEQSDFHKCIADVISWHKKYPDDWKQNWFEVQKKWSQEVGCPEGVFVPFDIDAKINAAYIVLGLLYGKGDYTTTLEIATRAGQDSDCNPSSAAGILGTIIGYEKIPEHWKMGLSEIEDMKFVYTNMSLNDVYEIGYKHALEMIKQGGGKVNDQEVRIAMQSPEKVKYEKSFEGLFPVKKVGIHENISDTLSFNFEGTGIAMRGEASKDEDSLPEYVLKADLFIDGKKVEELTMPTDSRVRKLELFWKYQLSKGNHEIKIILKNPRSKYKLRAIDYVVYADQAAEGIKAHQ